MPDIEHSTLDHTGLPGVSGGDSLYALEPGLFPPASPHADDDEFNDPNETDPTTTGWAWSNQAGVTARVSLGRLHFNAFASGNRGGHGLFKPFPASGDVRIVARVGGNHNVDFHGIEIGFLWGTLGTNTDYEMIGYRCDTSNVRIVQQARYTGGVGHTGTGTNRGAHAGPGQFAYLSLRLSGLDVVGEWTDSPIDENSWLAIASAAKGTRPDYYGIALSDEATSPVGANLQVWADFFRVNWSGSSWEPS